MAKTLFCQVDSTTLKIQQKNEKILEKGIAILKKNDIIDGTGEYGGIAQLVRVLA